LEKSHAVAAFNRISDILIVPHPLFLITACAERPRVACFGMWPFFFFPLARRIAAPRNDVQHI
jgi:hypothetical protein